MMITMVNYKKCRAMKKIITTILIAAAAFTACVQNNDEIIVKNEKISFNATLNAPASRTVLVEQDGKFHAEWTAGDKIYIYQVTDLSSRTSNNVDLTAGGPTASVNVEFKAATAQTSFHYIMASPKGSMNAVCTYMAFDGISGTQAPAAMNTFDGKSDFILSKAVERTAQPAGETINFENTRISAIAKVSVKNLALAADDEVVSVTFTCQQPIAGKITNVMLTDIVEGVDPMKQHTHATPVNTITVTLPETQKADFSYYMSVWPETLAAGETYAVVVTTKNDVYVKEGTIPADKPLVFTSGDITAFTVNMAGVKGENSGAGDDVVEAPAYIEVAGIKWATGNLEYEVGGEKSEGFADGWCIAPNQAHHFYTTGGDITAVDYNKVAHFNYGGIEDAFSISYTGALHVAAPVEGAVAFDLSGKMYTDGTCATETSDFAAAKYGDIAFWASKGKYRMPTESEFATLYANSCYTVASYKLSGVDVSGTYFYNPGEGETAGLVSGTKELSADDLAIGLFLPYSGRAYNNTEYNIYKANTQGFYRTSTVASVSKSDMGYGVIFRVNDHTNLSNTGTKAVNGNTTYNFGATSRYAIRPIYIEK